MTQPETPIVPPQTPTRLEMVANGATSAASATSWAYAASVTAIMSVWMIVTPMSLEVTPVLTLLAVVAALLAITTFYTVVRPVPAFQAALFGVLFISLYTNGMALISYLLASLAFPLHDSTFSSIDQAMGFDWLAWLQLMNNNSVIGNALTVAYHSSVVQVFAVILFTAFTLRLDRLRAFLALFAAGSSIAIVTAGFIPTVGPYAYYDAAPEMFNNLNANGGTWHLEHMMALRDGTLLSIDISKIEGLVSFPSFHTSLAIITVYVLRGVRFIFWPAAVLNALVILSTLSEGGHYLIDIFAGALMTAVAIWVYENWNRFRLAALLQRRLQPA